jgi:hypothetical protein
MKRCVILSFLMLFSSASIAAEGGSVTFKTSNFYIGGGLGFNSYAGGRSTGFQFLGGYEFTGKLNGDIASAIELGYMSTGTFESKDLNNGSTSSLNREAKGVWLNYVGSYPMGSRVEGLWRLGIDFGDDDGIMAGAGMGYNFNRHWALRSEYVVREAVNSFQFNLLYGF